MLAEARTRAKEPADALPTGPPDIVNNWLQMTLIRNACASAKARLGATLRNFFHIGMISEDMKLPCGTLVLVWYNPGAARTTTDDRDCGFRLGSIHQNLITPVVALEIHSNRFLKDVSLLPIRSIN